MKARRFWLIRFWGFLLVLSGLVLTTPLQAQTKSAYPKNGDGITTFLKRHGYSGTASQREFIELNKGKFGKNNSLILGVRYKLPVKGESSTKDTTQGSSGKRRQNYEPLFGKSLAKYNVTSSDLKGACFYLVSGHGGPDPGAIGKWVPIRCMRMSTLTISCCVWRGTCLCEAPRCTLSYKTPRMAYATSSS